MRIKSGNVERIVSDEVGKKLIAAEKAVEVKESAKESSTDLTKMKVDELKKLANERGIQNADSMKKEELIEALKDVV